VKVEAMITTRGFGVAGALDHGIVAPLAASVEAMGYSSFWVNDTPSGDGLAALAAAAAVTRNIRLGVGVIAVDRVPADEIIARIAELGLPVDRLLVGIGAGRTKVGSLDLIRRSANALRAAGIASAVGALGPRMVALTGEVADAALFNWLTPAAAARSTEALLASSDGHPVEPIAYVRTGFGPGSYQRLIEESGRYEAIPAYADHFARMGVRAVETCVHGEDAEEINRGLGAFDGTVRELVVRAIPGTESLDDYRALAQAAAPVVM
jgi:hypothetical protein